MNVINVTTQEVKSFYELKQEYPNVSFAYSDDGLQSFGYAVLNEDAYPQLTVYQNAESYISQVDGKFYRKYNVVNKTFATPEEKTAFINGMKKEKKNSVSQIRYQKEIAGIPFNGLTIGTDREDKGMLLGALTTLQRNGGTIRFKTNEGVFVELDATQLGQIYDLVAQHTQLMFDKESAHFTAIDNLPEDFEVVYNYNVNQNWE